MTYKKLQPHPTDEYVHWSFDLTRKKNREEIIVVREAYDKIEAAGLLAELGVVTRAARVAGQDDEADNHEDCDHW